MDIEIRQATIDDLVALNPVQLEGDLLHSRALPHIFRVPNPERTPAYDYLRACLMQEDAAVFLAEVEGRVVGLVLIVLQNAREFEGLQPRRLAVIQNVAVSADYRRRGIGKALMQAAHRWAAEQGIAQVELNVWSFNEGALRFYESLGYETASRKMWMTLPDGVTYE